MLQSRAQYGDRRNGVVRMSKQTCDKLINQIEMEIRSELGSDEAILRFEDAGTREQAATEWLAKLRERPALRQKLSQMSVTPGGQLSAVREVLHAAVDGAKNRIATEATKAPRRKKVAA